MTGFTETWHTAATTTLGLFWMAFWAFGLGYLISSMIQVFVTQERMRRTMGEAGTKSVLLGTFFGFISSSCSFAALSTTRALFAKGAGLIPSLAFLLASTNLVIELGIVIAVFLSWQFVVGEYVGGILLIVFMWIVVRLTKSEKLIKAAREHAQQQEGHHHHHGGDGSQDWTQLIASREGWQKVAGQYVMEWQMVWKDVTIGFTVAGIIAAFVPRSFFEALFLGSGSSKPAVYEVLAQALVGPVAAFFTFIGSMGNIPLAAVLYSNGVSYAGIMAFIFSDLVVFPVLRIQAQYYGWKMAAYILGVFLVVLVGTATLMHYGFALMGMLPDPSTAERVTGREFFAVDYTLFLNAAFILLTLGFVTWKALSTGIAWKPGKSAGERALLALSITAFLWLAVGVTLPHLLPAS